MTFEEWWEQNWLTIICLMPVGPGNAKETAGAIWQPATAAAMERCAQVCRERAGAHAVRGMQLPPLSGIRTQCLDRRDEARSCAIAIKEAADDL